MVAQALALAAALAAAAAAPPAPDAPLPAEPAALAGRMAQTDAALRLAVGAWRTADSGERRAPPADVTVLALDQQRALRLLARRPALAGATIPRLPAQTARIARAVVPAQVALRRLSAGWPPHRVRTGAAAPLGALRADYGAGQRRFGVGWNVLAAVNLVESQFGRLRNDSVSGAQGPMQFMPATWRAYGLGGDIHDPHDAILGAANMLRRNGAPRANSRALMAYNPSRLYVRAVLGYARLIAADADALPVLYSWQVYAGGRRLTGPGRG